MVRFFRRKTQSRRIIMGIILDELLESITTDDVAEQLRQVCDRITEEEILNPGSYLGPTGANIFLSLPAQVEAPIRHFVCLEREAAGEYIVSHWTRKVKQGSPLNRLKVWPVRSKEDTTVKILKRFAEQLKFVKGE